jgi:magnesium transporter
MQEDSTRAEALQAHVEARDWKALEQSLAGEPAQEVADVLLALPERSRVLLFRILPRPRAAEVFSHLDREDQNRLLDELTDDQTRDVLAHLTPDDRTHVFEELPAEVTRRALELLPPHKRRQAQELLGYPPESVGRLMTPDFVAVRPGWTVERCIDHIRAYGKDSETVHWIYVVDDDWKLIDDIQLGSIVLARPGTTVAELMDGSFACVSAMEDREEAVRLIQRYDVSALPVVDSNGVLLGIVTVDDVLDVAEAEATEDFHKAASVAPLRMRLRQAPIRTLYRSRVLWLLVLVAMNVFSGAGIAYFEDTIAATVALVFFLPLLIDSAGNAGSQAATLMVRALAIGDVAARDWVRLLGREVVVASALGLTMAIAVSVLGVLRGGPDVAVVVASTMVLVVVVGSVIGMSLPFLLTRFRVDPATASAPLVTSIADITGVLLYFSIASWYLGA